MTIDNAAEMAKRVRSYFTGNHPLGMTGEQRLMLDAADLIERQATEIERLNCQPRTPNPARDITAEANELLAAKDAEIERLKETAGRGMNCRVLSQGLNCKCALCRAERELASANEMLAANRAEVSRLESVVRDMSGELVTARRLLYGGIAGYTKLTRWTEEVKEFLKSPPSPRAESGSVAEVGCGPCGVGPDEPMTHEELLKFTKAIITDTARDEMRKLNEADAVAGCEKTPDELRASIDSLGERLKQVKSDYITLWRRVVQADSISSSDDPYPWERAIQEVEHWAEERRQLKAQIKKQRSRAEYAEKRNTELRAALYECDNKAPGWDVVCRVLDELSPGWNKAVYDRGMDSVVAAIRKLAATTTSCPPMTGEQLQRYLFEKCQKFFPEWENMMDEEYKNAYVSLASHIWPDAITKPDRRKELASQIVANTFGELMVLQLSGRVVYLDCDSGGWCAAEAGASGNLIHGGGFDTRDEAEKYAREWLIDRVMEGEQKP